MLLRVSYGGFVAPAFHTLRISSILFVQVAREGDRPVNTPASQKGTDTVKRGLAEMLKGGVIMDVVTPEQAKIAEEAGACAVMALERVPADIRADRSEEHTSELQSH